VDRLQRSHRVIVARRNWLRKTSIEVLPAKTTRAILADASAPGSRVPPPNVACQRTSDELHGLLVHTQDRYLRIIRRQYTSRTSLHMHGKFHVGLWRHGQRVLCVV